MSLSFDEHEFGRCRVSRCSGHLGEVDARLNWMPAIVLAIPHGTTMGSRCDLRIYERTNELTAHVIDRDTDVFGFPEREADFS